jgi:hypothetical protein
VRRATRAGCRKTNHKRSRSRPCAGVSVYMEIGFPNLPLAEFETDLEIRLFQHGSAGLGRSAFTSKRTLEPSPGGLTSRSADRCNSSFHRRTLAISICTMNITVRSRRVLFSNIIFRKQEPL